MVHIKLFPALLTVVLLGSNSKLHLCVIILNNVQTNNWGIPKALSWPHTLLSLSLAHLGLTARNDIVSFLSYADDTQLYLHILPVLRLWTHTRRDIKEWVALDEFVSSL